MANTCTVCNYPIKKANRTVHVSCADKVVPDDQPVTASTKRECCFCHSRETVMINGAPFCIEHRPGEQAPTKVRSRETLTFAAERCPRCGEAVTPAITKGSIKCKCDQPSPPRPCKPGCAIPHNHLSESAWLARMGKVPMQTRYGN